jgi:hypothetical protein
MLSPHIYVALAHERHQTFLAQAESDRRKRRARPHRQRGSAATGRPVVLRDGSAVELGYFTDVDHHDHEALGALDHADGRGVGIARYVRDADDPQAAEITLAPAE